jgi:phosphohistidine phosphatase
LKRGTFIFQEVTVKTLFLVRHAKSSWDDPMLDDFDRPLDRRGKKDAPRVGKRLRKEKIRPDIIISSPAKRALKTARAIAEQLRFPLKKIRKDASVYEADTAALMIAVRGIKDKHGTAMLFGHNPGISDLARFLTGENTGDIPTCGVYGMEFACKSWKKISKGKGKEILYISPKSELSYR